jgi:hypothetical protein
LSSTESARGLAQSKTWRTIGARDLSRFNTRFTRGPRCSPTPAALAARSGLKSALPHALAFCLLTSAFCLCASAQDYTNKWSTVDGGGRSSTGGVYTATGTIGQPDAGVIRAGEYTVNGGFWGIIAVQTPGAPPLSIRRGDGTNVLVCWPYPSDEYGLQQCTNLTTANWMADASVPVQTGKTRHLHRVADGGHASGSGVDVGLHCRCDGAGWGLEDVDYS